MPVFRVASMVAKLAQRGAKLHFCYEEGPSGYELYRQIIGLGHCCSVVAPSLILRRPGDRVKTNRRDAVSPARLHRADELTAGCQMKRMKPFAIWYARVRSQMMGPFHSILWPRAQTSDRPIGPPS